MVKEVILKLFASAELTPAGRPKMISDSEVELKYIEKINIETEKKEIIFYNYNVILTNMRLLVVPPQALSAQEKTCRVLHLRFVTNFTDNAGMFRSSRRITAHIVEGLRFHIRFNDRDKDMTLSMLGQALSRKAWKSVMEESKKKYAASKPESASISAHNAGVSGLKRRQEEVVVIRYSFHRQKNNHVVAF